MTREEIIAWLESPEGEEWSRANHRCSIRLISLKDDGFAFPDDWYEYSIWAA